MTAVTTTNPARSDVFATATAAEAPTSRRGWALAGLGAGVAGMATIVTSSMIDVVYRKQFEGNVDGLAAQLEHKAGVMFAFHSITALGALLMVVFAAGLHRRLRTVLPDSIAPTVAAAGLVGTAVVSVLGSGLDTEFMMPLGQGGIVDDATGAMYNHWVGTIPWLWTLAGLAGLGLYTAARRGGVPRWIGRVGLVLGGLTVVLGVSPLEYMAGVTGSLWLVITSLGLAFGDRAHRSAA